MPRKVVDLTYPIREDMPVYPAPWHTEVTLRQLGTHDAEGRETRELTVGTHTGTHCDAPRHFVPGGDSVDMLDLSTLIGPARVVDLSQVEAGAALDADRMEQELGASPPERIVLRFDWSDHWGTPEFYAAHPFLTQAAARWLAERDVKLIATDAPQLDDPSASQNGTSTSPNHKILLARGVVLVEYLCNLRELSQTDIELIVLPLKIAGADGSPVRCVAVERT